jgi:F-type H+-transporting ATPase subunit delta
VSRANRALREAASRILAEAEETDLRRLPDDLFAVAGLLAREHRLRRALGDPGIPPQVRRALLGDVLGDSVSAPAATLVGTTAELQRVQDRELVGLLEELAADAAFAQADADGELGRVQDELFRLKTAVEGSAELQMALSDPRVPDEAKVAAVSDLLEDRAAPTTVRLVRLTMEAGHSRDLARTLGELVGLAAVRRGELVAEVRTAIALDAARRRSLSDALSRAIGSAVSLEEILDPDVVGSLSIRIGDEVFDGSVKRQLELARERLGAA